MARVESALNTLGRRGSIFEQSRLSDTQHQTRVKVVDPLRLPDCVTRNGTTVYETRLTSSQHQTRVKKDTLDNVVLGSLHMGEKDGMVTTGMTLIIGLLDQG